jgi:hypothetical protein
VVGLKTQFPGRGLGAFWFSGALSALDRACLASFVRRGHDLKLFSYEPVPNLPEGVKAADAGDVLSRQMFERVLYNGAPDFAHFSDIFRYEMIASLDLVWVDVDILLIGGEVPLPYPNLLVREEQGSINNAVLYMSDQAVLNSVRALAQTKLDKELRWGETGPMLLTAALKELKRSVQIYDHDLFYPIEHYDVWKLLLPEHRDFCAGRCQNALTLHLFNNILSTIGYWKELAPPEGSYLHDKLKEQDLLAFFRDTYPSKIMRQSIENFRYRQSGKDLGVKAVLRELVPSIARTYQHYRK